MPPRITDVQPTANDPTEAKKYALVDSTVLLLDLAGNYLQGIPLDENGEPLNYDIDETSQGNLTGIGTTQQKTTQTWLRPNHQDTYVRVQSGWCRSKMEQLNGEDWLEVDFHGNIRCETSDSDDARTLGLCGGHADCERPLLFEADGGDDGPWITEWNVQLKLFANLEPSGSTLFGDIELFVGDARFWARNDQENNQWIVTQTVTSPQGGSAEEVTNNFPYQPQDTILNIPVYVPVTKDERLVLKGRINQKNTYGFNGFAMQSIMQSIDLHRLGWGLKGTLKYNGVGEE